MKTQNLLIATAMIFVLGANSLYSQIITGKVVDIDSNQPLVGVQVLVKGTTNGTIGNVDGKYTIEVDSLQNILVFSFIGYQSKELKVRGRRVIDVALIPDVAALEEVVVVGYGRQKTTMLTSCVTQASSKRLFRKSEKTSFQGGGIPNYEYESKPFNTEAYATIHENGFKKVSMSPLSTFSIDVDAASYSNLRRFINNGTLPPVDAVRIEEMINYFSYDYPQPDNNQPFSINTELAPCPWNKENLLLHVGLQGKEIALEALPPSNIVFLLDVSGSMSAYNKLPLLKSSLSLLVNQLRPEDRVAIVVYAGNSGLVLPSTSGNQKQSILESLNRLNAGGSTAGGAGLKLAYNVANSHFMEEGNNRIILATDGDFNVGQSSNAEMERLIEKEREKGIAISVLGFGMGNYKDDKMETIADKGNGNYAYIDNLQEAKKVLVNEFGGTLFTIAKDVKFQLEFNPVQVAEYRLIGYENRLLNDEDFEDDKKDAGEMGAGHTVTALYEIVLAKSTETSSDLKYQRASLSEEALKSNDLITLKLRYKDPDAYKSKLIEEVVKNNPISLKESSDNYRFSAAVAEFGMLLRSSELKGTTTWESAYLLAKDAKGNDEEGYRGELLRLIKSAELLKKSSAQR